MTRKITKERQSRAKKAAIEASRIILEHDQKILEIGKRRIIDLEKWLASGKSLECKEDFKEYGEKLLKFSDEHAKVTIEYSKKEFLIKNWDLIIEGINMRDKKERFSKKFYKNPNTGLLKYLMCRYDVTCKKCGQPFITRLGFVPKVPRLDERGDHWDHLKEVCKKISWPCLCPKCRVIKLEQTVKSGECFCVICGKKMPPGKRSHAETCGPTCRQRRHREKKDKIIVSSS